MQPQRVITYKVQVINDNIVVVYVTVLDAFDTDTTVFNDVRVELRSQSALVKGV